MFEKYHARKTTVGGITFASRKEAARYMELKALERAGRISDLKLQVPFLLIESHRKKNGRMEPKCTYVADFTYDVILSPGKTEHVVEDVKGFRTPVYVIKRKLMLDRYGIEIRET